MRNVTETPDTWLMDSGSKSKTGQVRAHAGDYRAKGPQKTITMKFLRQAK